MPKFRVTVELVTDRPDSNYPDHTEIYQQTIDDLDLKAVIIATNWSQSGDTPPPPVEPPSLDPADDTPTVKAPTNIEVKEAPDVEAANPTTNTTENN